MQLQGNTEKVIAKDKNSGNVPKLESAEVVLVNCNLVNNNYQQTSKVLFTFAPKKQFGHLINISPDSLTTLNNSKTKFSFTDQTSKKLEIEDNVSITLTPGTG